MPDSQETMESILPGNCHFTFDRASLDVPIQYPLIASTTPTGNSTAVLVPPSIVPASVGEYQSWLCRFSLDCMSDAPLSVLLDQPAQASDHNDTMVQDSDVHALSRVSHKLYTLIQEFLNQGNVGDLHLQSDVPARSARSPVIQNLRLAITFQLMLESAELSRGRSNLSAESPAHPSSQNEPCSGDSQEHSQNANFRTAIRGPGNFRETQTDTIDRSKWFPCTICGQRFPFAKRVTWHMKTHASPSRRLTRRSAVARKGMNEARTVPSSSVRESTPDTDMLAGNFELHPGIPSEFDLGSPLVGSHEQMKHQEAVHDLVAGVAQDVDDVRSAAAQLRQVDVEKAHDANERECPMDEAPGHIDAATLLARGSGSANTIRIDSRGRMFHPSTPNLHHCTQCPHSFTSKAALANHLKSHLIKPVTRAPRIPISREWKCTSCDRIFTTKQALSNHLKSHENIYKCPKCAKAYHRERDLAKHLVSHEDRRAGNCVCGRKFFKLTHLERHENVCEQHWALIESMKVPSYEPGN